MSDSQTIAFLNILFAVKVPVRDGVALGSTEFLDMCGQFASSVLTAFLCRWDSYDSPL